jgi:hypothetical protein
MINEDFIVEKFITRAPQKMAKMNEAAWVTPAPLKNTFCETQQGTYILANIADATSLFVLGKPIRIYGPRHL